ncbi:hypothetical protein [Novipirellula caenicola]
MFIDFANAGTSFAMLVIKWHRLSVPYTLEIDKREIFMAEATTRMGQESRRSEAYQHSEGTVARSIEKQTAKLPSDVFLWAAFASIGSSLLLRSVDRRDESLFVGQWAPTFLCLGIYNKIVKTAGSDRIRG